MHIIQWLLQIKFHLFGNHISNLIHLFSLMRDNDLFTKYRTLSTQTVFTLLITREYWTVDESIIYSWFWIISCIFSFLHLQSSHQSDRINIEAGLMNLDFLFSLWYCLSVNSFDPLCYLLTVIARDSSVFRRLTNIEYLTHSSIKPQDVEIFSFIFIHKLPKFEEL